MTNDSLTVTKFSYVIGYQEYDLSIVRVCLFSNREGLGTSL